MTFYVTDQNFVVLSLIILGIISGFVWDIFRCIGQFFKIGYVLSNITDFLLCILFAFAYQITVFVTNYGYVRWYEFAGAFLGIMLYRLALSKIVTTVLMSVISICSGIIGKVISAVLHPFVKLARGIRSIAMKYVFSKLFILMTEIFANIAAGKQISLAAKGFPCREERIVNEQRIQKAGSSFQSNDDIYNNRSYNSNNRSYLKNKRA